MLGLKSHSQSPNRDYDKWDDEPNYFDLTLTTKVEQWMVMRQQQDEKMKRKMVNLERKTELTMELDTDN